MTSCNVIEIDKRGSELKQFNAAYCRYLSARAQLFRPDFNVSEEEEDAAAEKWRKATWDLARTPAILNYQLAYKLAALRDLLEDADSGWFDQRDRALLESIRLDVKAL